MKKYLKVFVILFAIFIASEFGFGTAFGYGSGVTETINLTTANSWVTISPSTKLWSFDYTGADIDQILTYDASTSSFVVPSASDLLEPVNAFYFYPNKSTSVVYEYETYVPGNSDKSLYTGWNFVGTNTQGSAIDEFSTIQDSIYAIYVPDTLNNYKNVTASSWGADGNRDVDKTNWPATTLGSRDGYWINLSTPVTYSKRF